MFRARGLHHVLVLVTDLERARAFYGDLLGLKEVARPDFPRPGVWYRLEDGTEVHLIVYPEARSERPGKVDTDDAHFALAVDDFDGAVKAIEEAGVDCIVRRRSLTGYPQAYVMDPDGNIVELNGFAHKGAALEGLGNRGAPSGGV